MFKRVREALVALRTERLAMPDNKANGQDVIMSNGRLGAIAGRENKTLDERMGAIEELKKRADRGNAEAVSILASIGSDLERDRLDAPEEMKESVFKILEDFIIAIEDLHCLYGIYKSTDDTELKYKILDKIQRSIYSRDDEDDMPDSDAITAARIILEIERDQGYENGLTPQMVNSARDIT